MNSVNPTFRGSKVFAQFPNSQQAPFSGFVAGDRQLEPYGDLSFF
jgi:hypothetical protein